MKTFTNGVCMALVILCAPGLGWSQEQRVSNATLTYGITPTLGWKLVVWDGWTLIARVGARFRFSTPEGEEPFSPAFGLSFGYTS